VCQPTPDDEDLSKARRLLTIASMIASMQWGPSATTGAVAPQTEHDALRADGDSGQNEILEPIEARPAYISVGTEALADEDVRYANVACTD
jgi:hypothetical protein